MSVWASFSEALDQLETEGRRRFRRVASPPIGTRPIIDGRSVLAFCSNDYLGLAQDPEIAAAACAATRTHGTGAGAAHLISGHTDLHHHLEEKLAGFVGLPAALLFSTGYMANIGAVTALAGRDDAIFADKLNHASLNDAMALARAEVKRYPHNDLPALERMLSRSEKRRRIILTDAVFSMDGDIAPLPGLLELAERHDALLVIDDAHGFGVLGPQGRGSLAHFGLRSDRLILMGTLGKAAGVGGAFVAGDAVMVDWLVNRARTYIYTTASAPLLSAAASTSLRLIEEGEARRAHLRELIAYLRGRSAHLPWSWMPSPTPIQPLLIGDSVAARDLSQALLDRGIWVPAIRPPTVPGGTARLRVSLSAAHSFADIDELIAALSEIALERPD